MRPAPDASTLPHSVGEGEPGSCGIGRHPGHPLGCAAGADGAPVAVFARAEAALAAVAGQRAALHQRVAAARRRGRVPTDQDHAPELLALRPPGAAGRPLLLLGGMGPLAGLDGFAAACRSLGEQREIVLYQACHLPCRSRVLESAAEACLARCLGAAIRFGAARLGGADGPDPVDLVVLCNTAHHFLPAALARLAEDDPALAGRLCWHSLIAAAVAESRRTKADFGSVGRAGLRPAKGGRDGRPPDSSEIRSSRQVLVLASRGSRRAGLFRTPLHAAGVTCLEPDAPAQRLLDGAIAQGVKALDMEAALTLGSALCLRLAALRPVPDALIAGCTEVPLILDLVRRQGPAAARAWLDGLRVLDPVALVLDRLAGLPVAEAACTNT